MLDILSNVAVALRDHRPVVALESTLIAHALPWPLNLETARLAEAAVREQGAEAATIAVWQGRARIGLTDTELEQLARGSNIIKASRRDLAVTCSRGQSAATTVAATLFLAHK